MKKPSAAEPSAAWGSSADLGGAASAGVKLTEDYQLWAHGFALTATFRHSRDVLAALLKAPGASLEQLCGRLRANAGHVAVMLRTLSTLGWVARSSDGTYSTTRSVAIAAASPAITALCDAVYGAAARDNRADAPCCARLARLASWLPIIVAGWPSLPPEAADVPHLSTMLCGAILAPLLLELRMLSSSQSDMARDGSRGRATASVSLATIDEPTALAIGRFFELQMWGSFATSTRQLQLGAAGQFFLDRCPAFGVCLSYRPMLHQLSEASFGEVKRVFRYEGETEAWVDRRLNVIGSGFMHHRYFADMLRVHVRRIFDETPLANQPRVVADMGCGDGTLLKTIYQYVAAETLRGRHLEAYPLTMCGVDFNRDSLRETERTLAAAGVPHGLMLGDIGDPVPMQRELEVQFAVLRNQVLHVRSFLDHDRPYIPPSRPADALIERAINAASDATYVSNAHGGSLVTPSEVFHSLIEHWERWASCLGMHGLLVLEVNCLDVATTRTYMREATSMHFDCVQAHSGQLLTPAAHFSLAAAAAGLLPEEGTLSYPKEAGYTRIVLQQLRPAGLAIRLATLANVPELVALEAYWRSDVLSASEVRTMHAHLRIATVSALDTPPSHPAARLARCRQATLRQRICAHPTGQYVAITPGGEILGAMYTQRVLSYEVLLSAQRETELELHAPDGPVVQLLGVVQRPDAKVGDLLRRFVLLLARLDATVERVCGITRCRAYQPSRSAFFGASEAPSAEYQRYVESLTDPGLLFHSDAGATIGELVPNYRPRDVANLGYGVMVCYELRSHGPVARAPHAPGASAAAHAAAVELPTSLAECETLICEAIDGLSYCSRRHWDSDTKAAAFMDLDLDSLDAVKLVQTLSAALAPVLTLRSTVIFEHPTVRELAAFVYEQLRDGSAEFDSPAQHLQMPNHHLF